MMTEQQQYIDALKKAWDFIKAYGELSPARKEQLVKTVLQVSSIEEAFMILQNKFFPNGRM